MENLNQKVMQSATGEKRYNPDEQRLYFGTFAERVVLAIPLDESKEENIKSQFISMLKQLMDSYDHLSVKISPGLSVSDRCLYMKMAQEVNISATVVDEKCAHSPYGVVVHSNKAENVDKPLLSDRFANLIEKRKQVIAAKKSFWSKLLGRD